MPMLPVDLPDLSVIHQRDVHFHRAFKILHFQHGVAATANQQADAGRYFNGLLLVFNYDFELFHNS